MISLAEAQSFVVDGLEPLDSRALPLEETLGCVAAATVTAREPSPRFVNSSMDGFALRALDTAGGSVSLRIVGSVFAGDSGELSVGEGEASRVMTGAPLPVGADSVCMREEASLDADGSRVLIHREARAGEFVRLVGEDVAIGDILLHPGDIVGPAVVGVLSGQGTVSIDVRPQPRVGVLSTGNELSDSTSRLAPGKIRDSNRPALLASLRLAGCTPLDLGVAGDTMNEIAAAFQRGLRECDAIVSTGGVSVGDADFVKTVLGELCGDRARSMQVAIKPGKPFAYGVAPSGAPLFALAGNPVSTLVGFELFVRPALRILAGYSQHHRPTVRAILDCPLPRRRDGRDHFVHARSSFLSDGRLHVESVARQASHLLQAITGCNTLVVVPDGDGLEVGDVATVMVLDTNALNGA